MEWLLILLTLLTGLVLMIGDEPTWPDTSSWRFVPTGALTVMLMLTGVLLVVQYIP